jgi:hypothetical protein
MGDVTGSDSSAGSAVEVTVAVAVAVAAAAAVEVPASVTFAAASASSLCCVVLRGKERTECNRMRSDEGVGIDSGDG